MKITIQYLGVFHNTPKPLNRIAEFYNSRTREKVTRARVKTLMLSKSKKAQKSRTALPTLPQKIKAIKRCSP